jgi:hypothetical protein
MSDTENESIETSSDVFKDEEEEIFLKEEVETDPDYIPDREYDSDDSRYSSYDEEDEEEESETDEF